VRERDDLRSRVEALSLRDRALGTRLDRLDADLLALGERRGQASEAQRAELERARSALAAELEPELELGLVAVRLTESGLEVELAEPVLFRSGSAELSDKGRALLVRMAGDLRTTPYPVLVAGYTDDVPIGGALAETWPTNWDLAAARASRVVAVLESGGVPGRQLLAVSFGPNDPVAPNDSPEGRARNRRIELHIRPIPSEPEPEGEPP
jgi:chemotaxis protein MotB